MGSKMRVQTPGQAKSRARKLACRRQKQARYQEEARRRGIPVGQVPFVLFQEMQEGQRQRAAEVQRRLEEMSRRRRSPWDPW